MKVKVKEVTAEDLAKTKQIQLNKCKAFFQIAPYATKLYMAMKTKIDLDFISKNWEEITK